MNSFEYFLEITKIPRPSYKEGKIALFIQQFAEKQGLKYEVDTHHNVKIFKDNGSKQTVMLQAHLDMVCEKLKTKLFDFDTQGIETKIEGDYIMAKDTTLGADDGSGVATILAVLDNFGAGYPNIEAVFTTCEEVGMDGAKSLNYSGLKSKYIIGLDGTQLGQIDISCAGSVNIKFLKDYSNQLETITSNQICSKNSTDEKFRLYNLSLSGLLGGHSGDDIDKNRVNAIKIATEFLSSIKNVKLVSLLGGGKDNAIPREIECEILTNDNEIEDKFQQFLTEFKTKFEKELNAKMTLTNKNSQGNLVCLSNNGSINLLNFINEFRNGVLQKNGESVVLSNNFANIKLEKGQLVAICKLRGNSDELEDIEIAEVKKLCKKFDIEYQISGKSPLFHTDIDNPLVKIAVDTFKHSKRVATPQEIHAGIEGGVFAEHLGDVSIICLGADLFDIHTPNEKMKISSLHELFSWVERILKELNKLPV